LRFRRHAILRDDDRNRGLFRRAGRDILVIAGATGAAQLIAFAAAPLITRLYAPEAFGRFAVFSAAVTIVYPLATLRYEWALPLAADEETALDLLALCAIILAGSSTVAAAAAVIFGTSAAPALEHWTGLSVTDLLLLPLAIAAFSLNGVATSWLTRDGAFALIARLRFAVTVGMVAGQVILGWLPVGPNGLILGFIGGYLAGPALQARHLRPALARSLTRMRPARLRRVATEYRRFATMTAPFNLINAVGSQLPNLAFPALYSFALAGQYALAQRVLSQPAVFVGQAVNQVFWGGAARLLREDPVRLPSLFLWLNTVLLAAMAPGFLLAWVGPDLFSIVFGPPWSEAGGFAGALFVATFLSLAAQGTTGLHIYGLNHWMAGWEILQFALVAAALAGAAHSGLTPFGCVGAVSAALALANAALLALNFAAIRRATRGAAAVDWAASRPRSDESRP
jgi:O-antigen/teichoic acid export membrane protein